MKLKPMTTIVENEPLPVRRITAPSTPEPAALCTIATVLLRKHRVLFDNNTSKDALQCLKYLSRSMERQLSDRESEKAIAHVAAVRGGA